MANNSCEEILACLSANGLTVGSTSSVPEEIRLFDDAALWTLAAGLAILNPPVGIIAAGAAATYGGNKNAIWDGIATWQNTIIPASQILYGYYMWDAPHPEDISEDFWAIYNLSVEHNIDFDTAARIWEIMGRGNVDFDTARRIFLLGGFPPNLEGMLVDPYPEDLSEDFWAAYNTWIHDPQYAGMDWDAFLEGYGDESDSEKIAGKGAKIKGGVTLNLDDPKNPLGQSIRQIVQSELRGGKDGSGVLPQIEKIKEKAAKTDEKMQEITVRIRQVQSEVNSVRATVVLLERTVNAIRDTLGNGLYRPAGHNQSESHIPGRATPTAN